MDSHIPSSRGHVLLASGSREEIGDWKVYLRSEVAYFSMLVTLLLLFFYFSILLATGI